MSSHGAVAIGHHGVRLVADIYHVDPNGLPPCVLLHGGGQNRLAWAATATVLQSAGHRVVAYDARGHGDSEWDQTGDYDPDDLSRDLLAVRAQLIGPRPAVAVGASLGGMSILNAHRLAPAELWAGVVVVDVTPRMELDSARRIIDFMGSHPEGFGSLEEASAVIAAYNPHRAHDGRLDGLAKVLRQREDGRWMWRWDPAFVTSKVDAMRNDPGATAVRVEMLAGQLLDGARRVTAPTLLVRGALSDLVTNAAVDEFLEAVPHAEAVDVSGVGHMVAGDDNVTFTSAVLDFLRRHFSQKANRSDPTP